MHYGRRQRNLLSPPPPYSSLAVTRTETYLLLREAGYIVPAPRLGTYLLLRVAVSKSLTKVHEPWCRGALGARAVVA